jgi:hypothetical protein
MNHRQDTYFLASRHLLRIRYASNLISYSEPVVEGCLATAEVLRFPKNESSFSDATVPKKGIAEFGVSVEVLDALSRSRPLHQATSRSHAASRPARRFDIPGLARDTVPRPRLPHAGGSREIAPDE